MNYVVTRENRFSLVVISSTIQINNLFVLVYLTLPLPQFIVINAIKRIFKLCQSISMKYIYIYIYIYNDVVNIMHGPKIWESWACQLCWVFLAMVAKEIPVKTITADTSCILYVSKTAQWGIVKLLNHTCASELTDLLIIIAIYNLVWLLCQSHLHDNLLHVILLSGWTFTHWDHKKMANILQMTFSHAFSWKKCLLLQSLLKIPSTYQITNMPSLVQLLACHLFRTNPTIQIIRTYVNFLVVIAI